MISSAGGPEAKMQGYERMPAAGKVSIITPTFNRAHTIADTLQSLERQSYSSWECIVVDDDSNDETAELVRGYEQADARIQYVARSRSPKGACSCRNVGVEMATGEFVMFLDSDDVLGAHCLAQRIQAFAESPDNDFMAFPALLFRSTPGDEDILWNVLTEEDESIRFLRLDSPWQGTGPMWRLESFRKLGGWSEELACWQDVELSLRGFSQRMRYSVRYDLPPDLYIRRGDGRSVSSAALWSPEKLGSKLAVLAAAVEYAGTRREPSYRQAIRSMLATVANDHARARHTAQAVAISRWGRRLGLLNFGEFVLCVFSACLHVRGMNKLIGSSLIRSLAASYYSSPSTLAMVRYPGIRAPQP